MVILFQQFIIKFWLKCYNSISKINLYWPIYSILKFGLNKNLKYDLRHMFGLCIFVFFEFLQQSIQILIIKTHENNNQNKKYELTNNAAGEVHFLDSGP